MKNKQKDKLIYYRWFKGVASLKQWIKLLSLALIVALGGCNNKTEVKIFSTLNDYIANQNECNVNNQILTDLISTEADIYNDLIERGLDSFNEVAPLFEEGKKNTQESHEYLTQYQTCILKGRLDEQVLRKEIDTIKDVTVKSETEELVTKYVQYETALINYVDSLLKLNTTQSEFYTSVNETTTMSQLDELVTTINSAINVVSDDTLIHQQSSEEFNRSYTSYYEKYIQ